MLYQFVMFFLDTVYIGSVCQGRPQALGSGGGALVPLEML